MLFSWEVLSMSKSEDTKQLILDTAKKEFMEKGYNDASVRSIAKQAGLTTGAIFRYFADKESLFAALVSPVADHMLDLYRKGGERGFASLTDGHPENMWNISDEVISVLVEYIFANKDAFYLLISQSAGSAYESFVDQLPSLYNSCFLEMASQNTLSKEAAKQGKSYRDRTGSNHVPRAGEHIELHIKDFLRKAFRGCLCHITFPSSPDRNSVSDNHAEAITRPPDGVAQRLPIAVLAQHHKLADYTYQQKIRKQEYIAA